MATAASAFTWASHETTLKAWLGVSGATYDAQLTMLLAAAAVDCDNFCGWYYTDEDGEQVDETPTDPAAEPLIKLGVYEWVKAAWAMYSSPAAEGVQSVSTGQLQENYSGGVGGMNGVRLARRVAWPLWESAVNNLLLLGKAS